MNDERTGECLQLLAKSCDDDFNLANRNPWFSSFLQQQPFNQGNPDRNH